MLDNIIAPVKVDDFFLDYWEKKPLVVNRHTPDYFAHLLTLDAIDQVITTSDIRFPDIRVISAAHEIASSDYTMGGGRLKPDSVMKLYQEGGTVILNHQHKWQPALAKFCRALELVFSQPFQTNIYLTPPNAQGFGIHFDTHDVFVLQIAGSKDWKIFDSAIDLPLAGQGFNPTDEDIGETQMTCTLEAGDLLYIPRGILHEASSLDDLSLHATVGILSKTWADFILEAVSQVIVSDPNFRLAMPVGFAQPDFDQSKAETTFHDLLSDLTRKIDFNAVFDTYVNEFVDTRAPLLQGQMKQISQIAGLDSKSTIRLREGVVFRLERGSDTISLSFYGKTIELPFSCEKPLQTLLSANEVILKDLPRDEEDNEIEDILILIRRLISEGFIELVD